MKRTDTLRRRLLGQELARHRLATRQGDAAASWHALERAHILAQPALGDHLRVHLAMLAHAVRTRDPGEAVGQVLRVLLAPIGALTGHLPIGNTGRSNVSAFTPMRVPADLADALAGSEP
ncbi:MAG TPA: DUF3703 domain-containing protein [Novosphingobium sp.]